jgi:hypothetical protein
MGCANHVVNAYHTYGDKTPEAVEFREAGSLAGREGMTGLGGDGLQAARSWGDILQLNREH